MRVLMLGWEYPPHITGGLGNACRGLARALVRQGLSVRFVMPRPAVGSTKHDDGLDTVMIDPAQDSVGPTNPTEPMNPVMQPDLSLSQDLDADADHEARAGSQFTVSHGTADKVAAAAIWQNPLEPRRDHVADGPVHGEDAGAVFGGVEVWRLRVDAAWQSVYPGSRFMKTAADYDQPLRGLTPRAAGMPVAGRSDVQRYIDSFFATSTADMPGCQSEASPGVEPSPEKLAGADAGHVLESGAGNSPASTPATESRRLDFDPDFDGPHAQVYPGDPVQGARAFADAVVERLIAEPFDLIHANDWVTFPAALALGKAWSVPVVLHVHSLESDRSPTNPNLTISDLEARSLKQADAVVAVSMHTREKIVAEYAVEPDRAFVVYNGVEMQAVWENLGLIHRDDDERIGTAVLFLGRVTEQKGPRQFLYACAKVREKHPNAYFVMAGDGDLLPDCRELARELGLTDHIAFTGFLSAKQVRQALQQADVLVVPSLSEPFGLVVLEAASQGVPAVVSEQAGVAEAMHHLIKCDPQNAEDIADKVLGVLRHPVMREELRLGARAELLRLSWDAGARRCLDVYRTLRAVSL